MIPSDAALALAAERGRAPKPDPVALLTDDDRVRADFIDATLDAGVEQSFDGGMFDLRVPANFASPAAVAEVRRRWASSEGKWTAGVFLHPTGGDVAEYQIVLAPGTRVAGVVPSSVPVVSGGVDISRHARIVAARSRAGLARDAAALSAALSAAGWSHEVCDPDGAIPTGKVPLQVHLENVAPDLLPLAERNVAVPNPEFWVGGAALGVEVWAKTRHAEEVFRALGADVRYVGWTSADRLDESVPRERSFFHACGTSHRKGTSAIVRAWRPEWPPLVVVAEPAPWWRDLPECTWVNEERAPNVRVVLGHVSDDHLRELQNRSQFHVYLSAYEGYGHAIWEGLSCGAVVVVPDGPPFATESAPFVRASSCEITLAPSGLVRDCMVRTAELAFAVMNCAGGTMQYLSQRSASARSAWKISGEAFHQRVSEALA